MRVFLLILALWVHLPAGESVQSLDGTWQFTIKPEQVATPGNGWSTITVPGNWDVVPDYAKHKGKGWYRRTFTPDDSCKGKSIRLRFEAVYHDAEVILNGTVLGTHCGGYTPFEFDVTDRIKFNAENTLVVCADNTYRRGAWWAWGGISRSVSLIANEPVRLEWQHIRAEPDLATGTAKVLVRYRLQNTGNSTATTQMTSRLDQSATPLITREVVVPARQAIEVDVEANLPKEQVRLWHFDHPNLYRLTTQVAVAGKLQHERSDRFGIRKVGVTPTALVLNGEPMRVTGFNRIGDSPTVGNTEPDALVRTDVALMKRAGAVMSRIMHYPQAPNLLDLLDEQGMMVICEIPVWGKDDPQIKVDNPLCRQWLTEMITRDYNHPCIIGWSVGNEMVGHHDYAISMMDFIRKDLDPHRLVSFASNTALKPEVKDPFDRADLSMVNFYGKWADSATRVAGKWPSKPVFLSEFGSNQLKADGQLDRTFLANWQKLTPGTPQVIGVSLWCFNDYRSDRFGTPASGFRTWGVVDEHRKPKPAYQQIREFYSPVRTLTVVGRTVTVEARHRDEIPSYALRGYRLAWAPVGEASAKEGLDLPDLKPGDPAWMTTLPASVKPGWELRLMTPTGYDVASVGIGGP